MTPFLANLARQNLRRPVRARRQIVQARRKLPWANEGFRHLGNPFNDLGIALQRLLPPDRLAEMQRKLDKIAQEADAARAALAQGGK